MNKHIVVGLSGGVDSAVTAWLLKDKGFKVTGLFMKNWEDDDDDEFCTSKQDLIDAVSVSEKIGIDIEVVNFAKEYKEKVFSLFISGLEKGITPNPDILCNSEIKFEAFLNHAIKMGASKIATGHYANVYEKNGLHFLSKGFDGTKDQSYFLHRLNQTQLAKSVFPLGGLLKSDVRDLAKKHSLHNHDRKDSTGICFIGERPFADFISQYIKKTPGSIINEDGKVIGKHNGVNFYTIGQRKIGVSLGPNPTYVININPEDNTVVVGTKEDLKKQEMFVRNINYLKYEKIENGMECLVKVRYKHKGEMATVTNDGDNLKVLFHKKVEGIAPGQSAAIYEGDDLIAGGFIMKK